MTPADAITLSLCHWCGYVFPLLWPMGLEHLLTGILIHPSGSANPPLTHKDTVQHHVTRLRNGAKALYTTCKDWTPSGEIITVKVCVRLSDRGSGECVLGHRGELLLLPHSARWRGSRLKRPSRSKGNPRDKLVQQNVLRCFLWSQLWSTGKKDNHVFSHPSTDPWIY